MKFDQAAARVLAMLVFPGFVAAFDMWGKCNAGPVGTCAYFGCDPLRGPNQCVGHSCMCKKGYCADINNVFNKCRAEVGTCHVTPCNPLTHGGVLAVECVNGYCLCHSGYHPEEKDPKVCTRASSLSLAASNQTAAIGDATFVEEQDKSLPSPSIIVCISFALFVALAAFKIFKPNAMGLSQPFLEEH